MRQSQTEARSPAACAPRPRCAGRRRRRSLESARDASTVHSPRACARAAPPPRCLGSADVGVHTACIYCITITEGTFVCGCSDSLSQRMGEVAKGGWKYTPPCPRPPACKARQRAQGQQHSLDRVLRLAWPRAGGSVIIFCATMCISIETRYSES